MINKTENDNSLNVVINIMMTSYMYEIQNNLNFDYQKYRILYICIQTNLIKHFRNIYKIHIYIHTLLIS